MTRKKSKPDLLKIFFLTFIFLGAMSGSANAAPVPGDYDGDGLADLSIATINKGSGTTTWLSRLASGGPSFVNTFASAADFLVNGHYFSDGRAYPGIVSIKTSSNALEWRIKNSVGTENVLNFGLPGDGVPNAGDLDCDGVSDIAVTRAGSGAFTGFRFWYVALSSTPGQVTEDLFGLNGDRLATADMDGDGCSELVAIRNDFTWYSKKLSSTDVSAVQWGLTGDIPLLPLDLNNDGAADYIVVRNFGGVQYAIVRYSPVFAELYALGSSTSVPMLGNFWFQGPNFAWAQRNAGLTGVRTPAGTPLVIAFGNGSSSIVRPDGTVVHAADTGGLDDAGVPGYDETNGAPCTRMLDNEDGNDNFVFKPISHGTPSASSILFPANPYKSATPIANLALWKDGTPLVFRGEYRGLTNPDRPTFHFPRNGSAYGENVTLVLTLRNGQTHCIFLPDPSRRWD